MLICLPTLRFFALKLVLRTLELLNAQAFTTQYSPRSSSVSVAVSMTAANLAWAVQSSLLSVFPGTGEPFIFASLRQLYKVCKLMPSERISSAAV